MKLLVVRVEGALKSVMEKLAVKTGVSLSEVARDLILVGIDVQRHGGIEVVGPTGLIIRPFARLGFGGEEEKSLAIWVEEDLTEELRKEFKGSLRSALREALHLGMLRLRPGDVEIRGLFGVMRPFATVTFPELSDRTKEALRRLQVEEEQQ